MSQTQTQTFNTPEALINGLVPILVTLGKSNPYVYMDIFFNGGDVQWSWHQSELEEENEENRGLIMRNLEFLPWPDTSNGHSTVVYGEGDGDGHTITVTLT